MGSEAADDLARHEAVMRKQREARAKSINGLISAVAIAGVMLALVGAVAGSAVLLRWGF